MPPDFGRTTNARMAETDGSVSDLAWFADGSHVAFVSMARDHHHLWLRVADARTGAVRTVIEEPIPTTVSWRYDFPQWQVLPASQEVVWWSQRDDWGQLYLYDLATGRLKHRITRGVGNVHRIVRIDERTRTLWYEGSGQEPGRDPYFRHLYRVGLDGRGARLLTPEDAHHDIAMSPDGRYLVDTYSTPDRPPVTVLRDADGRVVLPLERGDLSRLVASGWRAPLPFTVTARDGVTELYGLMYLPSRLDTTATYPIVDVVYPGPQTGGIGSRAFLPARGDQQALAELGFVVVQIDALGTPGRSKRFQDATLGRLHDNGLPDQVAGIRQLSRRHRFLDSTRVGIWGGSGGGYAAAAALFRYPEFFTVGVAIAGNHDQRSYMDGWGERWQGPFVRTDSSDSYAAAANAAYAANLRGKLLLVYGGMDDNVHPANTLLVVDALIRAGRDFDLLVLPNAGHDPGAYAPYVIRRRWDYFVRHLLGAEPPREYPLGGRPAALP
jgi:dipeptidyl aminopeptidase/acylaminoacyl peptidase